MSEELKPCPFCNGSPEIDIDEFSDNFKKISIDCSECGASISGNYRIENHPKNTYDNYLEERKELIHQWNRRA